MSTDQQYTRELLDKWYHNQASDAEKQALFALLTDANLESSLVPLIKDEWQQLQPQEIFSTAEVDALAAQVLHRIVPADQPETDPGVHRIQFFKTAWIRYAAAIVLIIGTGAYLWNKHPSVKNTQLISRSSLKTAIVPGKEGAILTLANGSTVMLDSLGNGIVADQSGTDVILKNGQLLYGPVKNTAAETLYNTMTTPRGRQFKVVLPDGTMVWLNAASSIRYPTSFRGTERRVEITGEVYFEVVKDRHLPFKVRINERTEVEVLGTNFNINAYDNEPATSTTLLEGSVRINIGHQQQLLQPAEQAVVSGDKLKVKKVDTVEVMAWKNGVFNFNGADLPTVMRQVERWYDIEVVYGGVFRGRTFTGDIPRSAHLSELLKLFEVSKIHCSLDETGRKLTIMP